MAKLIVIVGVTGIQGSSIATTFLALPNWKVRGISRSPDSTASKALISRGVEIIQGDLDDKSSLAAAFVGATVIYANTDWVTHFTYALRHPEVLNGRVENQYAYDREVEQGLNIAEAAASETVLKTLNRFIYSSLSDARKGSNGEYPNVYHNNCKIDTINLIHERFPVVGKRLSTVQLAHYVTNWQHSPQLKPAKQTDGSYLIRHTFSPDFPMPFMVAHRDTGAFVKALVDLPPGTNIIGVSEIMSWREYTRVWGEVNGVKAIFRQVSPDEYFESVPTPLKKELWDTFRYVEEFGYRGGDESVLTAEELGVDVPVTSVEEYIRSEDWSVV
ncbi:hypothetical protein BJY04DRAFT_199085 [Aspergillus karnatakaensis]|uniref:uncharacterized protein n=1 Tax=Aspergillus karnatakaensis TaxID=1810916 RepID=UPI003CCDE6E1